MQRTRGLTPWLGRPLVAAVLMAATLLVSCAGDDIAAPNTIAPLSSTSLATTTSGAAASTTTVATTFADDPPVQLSADGPWQRVASAPGITKPGLTYLLMPGVWVYLPTEENLDLGITWVLNEADRPIIEAYLMAKLVYFSAATSNPIDLELPSWTEWYTDGGELYMPQLRERRAQGQVGHTGKGIVLRPEVMGEERSADRALISDCILDGAYFVMPNGELAPGSTTEVMKEGSAARLFLKNKWIVDQIGPQQGVCEFND